MDPSGSDAHPIAKHEANRKTATDSLRRHRQGQAVPVPFGEKRPQIERPRAPASAAGRPTTKEETMASTPSVSIPKKIGAHEAAFGVVRAWRFELIADVGEPTGVFGFTKDGRPGIGLFDGVSNPPAAEMILEKEGPAVRLNDDNGRARIKIGLRKCGPFITITQRDKPQNVLRLVLALDDDTSILKVVIYDSRGRPMEFVKKYQKRFAARRYEEILGKFVATRKKAAFIRALSQYFDVHDRDLAEAMWRSATSDDEGHGGAAREAEDSHGRSRRSQGQKMAKDAEAWLRRQLDGLGGPASWRRG